MDSCHLEEFAVRILRYQQTLGGTSFSEMIVTIGLEAKKVDLGTLSDLKAWSKLPNLPYRGPRFIARNFGQASHDAFQLADIFKISKRPNSMAVT
jgi:hypothetical protein